MWVRWRGWWRGGEVGVGRWRGTLSYKLTEGSAVHKLWIVDNVESGSVHRSAFKDRTRKGHRHGHSARLTVKPSLQR